MKDEYLYIRNIAVLYLGAQTVAKRENAFSRDHAQVLYRYASM